MQNPSVTILIPPPAKTSPRPALKVLACDLDADPCLQAYLDCTEIGEVIYIRKGSLEKRKHNRPAQKTTSKPKANPTPNSKGNANSKGKGNPTP